MNAWQLWQGLYNGKVMGIGRAANGLYLLKDAVQVIVGAAIKNVDSIDLWHLRLGHPSERAMQHIHSIRSHVNFGTPHYCQICPLAKQTRLQFPNSITSCIMFSNCSI
ncbi:uncharacterized protein LOC132029383 [Lycium ferocissimum]|uniref:uncharacterized protein LOC132029383 n=1 Tax=Lycium ferocissimum TaxID=112874 RepID=UPI002815A0F9|nr:uncharacterized protein LOC132029383 [Lycium ferocissimum]